MAETKTNQLDDLASTVKETLEASIKKLTEDIASVTTEHETMRERHDRERAELAERHAEEIKEFGQNQTLVDINALRKASMTSAKFLDDLGADISIEIPKIPTFGGRSSSGRSDAAVKPTEGYPTIISVVKAVLTETPDGMNASDIAEKAMSDGMIEEGPSLKEVKSSIQSTLNYGATKSVFEKSKAPDGYHNVWLVCATED
mgnify:CR=1 FL=1